MARRNDIRNSRPKIIITSYLGREEIREKRLARHIEQRKAITDMFPNLRAVSICSGYTKKELGELINPKTCNSNDVIALEKRTAKYIKHRMVLEKFYNRDKKKIKSVLFLDDDTIPAEMPDIPASTVEEVAWMLNQPEEMPGRCIFFSCKGLIFDTYYNQRLGKDPYIMAPLQVVGWAIMIRSDLNVMPNPKLMEYPDGTAIPTDDLAFRVQCAAEGKEVIKSQFLFFSAITNEKHSTLVDDHTDRKEGRAKSIQHISNTYPHILQVKNDKMIPIWKRKEKELIDLAAKGFFIKTHYGFVPHPENIKVLFKAGPKGFFQ